MRDHAGYEKEKIQKEQTIVVKKLASVSSLSPNEVLPVRSASVRNILTIQT